VTHTQLTDTDRDRAALYALGILDPDETRAFAAHLAGCAACSEEVASMKAVAGDLSLAAGAAVPPPHVRRRVLDEVGRLSGGGFLFRTKDEGGWRELSPGVSRRELGPSSFLIRLAPGHALRPHRHAAVEHCYVLEGDLLVNDRRLEAGDYHEAGPGTLHDGLVTSGGCLFLVVESPGASV
jgi:anti-sigma factor ChrR (cupin superfamily)